MSEETELSQEEQSKVGVLVVEDSDTEAMAICSLLERLNMRVHRCSDLSSAHMIGDVSVILLDLNLHTTVGVATWRKCHQGFPHVPIVILTHNDDLAMAKTCISEGASGYFIKGKYNTQELCDSLLRASDVFKTTTEEELARRSASLNMINQLREALNQVSEALLGPDN